MAHRIRPLHFKTNSEKLCNGIWPWNYGIRARLPYHYKRRIVEKHMELTKSPVAVHWKVDHRKYKPDEWGEREEVQNVPFPVYFPPEADQGLWGGEGVVKGYYKKKRKYGLRLPHIWMPGLLRRIYFSDILCKWMEITVTRTTMNQIDEAAGFDNYILKTSDAHLHSKLGVKLKGLMLHTLATKPPYPDDADTRQKIYKKYEKFMIPAEEAEWVGLTLEEAEEKQRDIEEHMQKADVKPLKQIYSAHLISKLQTVMNGKIGHKLQETNIRSQGHP